MTMGAPVRTQPVSRRPLVGPAPVGPAESGAVEFGAVLGAGQHLGDDSSLDYTEPCVMGRLLSVNDAGDVTRVSDPLQGLAGKPIRGAAVLFPGAMRLADPDADREPITAHLQLVAEALGAVAESGAWVVFGSGAARRLPDGVDPAAAMRRLAEVTREAHTILAAAGLELLVEPLRAEETNVFNRFADTMATLDAHGLDDVRVVCDTYHLHHLGQTIDDVLPHLDRVGHVHLSDHERALVTADIFPVVADTAALLEVGYLGRFSFECRYDDLSRDLDASVGHMKQCLGL